MRFMMIVKASADSEAGAKASPDLVEAMGRFNEQMAKAGILLDGMGLRPSSDGARIVFDGRAKPQVLDGPFAETKELVAGFWLIQVGSKEEAIEWGKRCPSPHGPGPARCDRDPSRLRKRRAGRDPAQRRDRRTIRAADGIDEV